MDKLSKPGYKRTELGWIPEDWEVWKIDQIALKVGSGITPSGGQKVYKTSGRPFVRSQNVSWGKMNLEDIAFIDDETHSKFTSTEILEGDVFLNITGASIGRSAVAQTELIGGNVNQHVCIIRSNLNDIKPKYLNCLLLSFLGQKQIFDFQAGGNREGLNFYQVRSLKFALPPLPEQTTIATVLSDMDSYIQSLEALIAKKRLIKQGAMQELLTPKEDWEVRKLTDIVDYIHGKAHEQFIVEDGKYIVVNSKFISSEGEVKKYSDFSFCTAKENDVLTVLSDLPNGKALAKCFFVLEEKKYAVNQRICIWRPKSALPRFIFYLLNRNKYFLGFDDGVSQTHILNNHIEKCFMEVPSKMDEQKFIADTLWKMDSELRALGNSLSKAVQLKQGMMQELLTGRTRLV